LIRILCDSEIDFQLGSYFSLYGCSLKQYKIASNIVNGASLDAEVGTYIVPTHDRKIASLWGYVFQIIFQVIGLDI